MRVSKRLSCQDKLHLNTFGVADWELTCLEDKRDNSARYEIRGTDYYAETLVCKNLPKHTPIEQVEKEGLEAFKTFLKEQITLLEDGVRQIGEIND